MEHVNNNLARLTTSAPGMGWISTRRPAAAGADRTRQARAQLSPTSLFMGLPRKRESSPVMGRVHPTTGEAPADTTPHIRGVRSPEAGRLRPIEWAITPIQGEVCAQKFLFISMLQFAKLALVCIVCLKKRHTTRQPKRQPKPNMGQSTGPHPASTRRDFQAVN